MQIEQSVIDALVSRPAEGLNVEVKRWIDPDSNAGIEKIVKAALALRNRNGGYLVIGFDDNTLSPDVGHELADARGVFHLDKIQGLVSRYASELFEVGVGFSQRDEIDHPVIMIPDGVRTPVAAKRDLIDGGKTLIRHGAVYFRTLAANGTPSTAEARPEDWREIVETCFDNREADVGRFLRRQLGGGDVAALVAALREIGLTTSAPPPPTLRQRSEALLEDGERRFQLALQTRQLTPEQAMLVTLGSWSVAMVIDPLHPDARPDHKFSTVIRASNPNYTGWPVWLDSSAFVDDTARPKVKDKAVETLIISHNGWSKELDFMRLDPRGEFYLRRILQDDATNKVAPETALDPVIVVLRVAEAIAVGLAFAKALDWESQQTRLGFTFCWRKLQGRMLSRWAEAYGGLRGGTAHDDKVTTFTELSLDTPISAIAPLVEQAIQDLFVLFDGYVLPRDVIEDWVRKLIERRLA